MSEKGYGDKMERNETLDQLFEAVLTLQNIDECYEFFSDACTPKEIQNVAQRFVVAKMLNDKKPYLEIVDATGASTATISRVSRAINKGFNLAFERVEK